MALTPELGGNALLEAVGGHPQVGLKSLSRQETAGTHLQRPHPGIHGPQGQSWPSSPPPQLPAHKNSSLQTTCPPPASENSRTSLNALATSPSLLLLLSSQPVASAFSPRIQILSRPPSYRDLCFPPSAFVWEEWKPFTFGLTHLHLPLSGRGTKATPLRHPLYGFCFPEHSH